MRKLLAKRIVWLLLIAFAVPSLGLIVTVTRVPWLRSLELAIFDIHERKLALLNPDPRIVVVGMYDDTPEHLGEDSFPLSRALHAQVIDMLRANGARVIAFDMWFTAPAKPADDRGFAKALKSNPGVIAALKADFRLIGTEEEIGFTEAEPSLRPFLTPGSIVVQRSFGSRVRWFPPYPQDSTSGKRYPALSLAAAAQYSGNGASPITVRDRLTMGSIEAPLGPRGELFIRYAGPPGTFKPIRYEDLITGDWRTSHPADYFRGKIVLIGRISSNEDNQDTPVGQMHGVEIVANEIQTLLQALNLNHWSEFSNLLLKYILCASLAFAVWRAGIWYGLFYTVFMSVVWSLMADRLFRQSGIWADTVEPLASLMISFVAMALLETRRLRLAFGRLMPEQDAGMLLSGDANAPGATVEREVTVVFCDIRNYTRLSESLPSATVESLLHRFYSAGERAADARASRGDLDKFVGDEMMLRFEAPGKTRGDHNAIRAVRWAFAMQKFALELNDSGEAGDTGFRIGIGIATGTVRVGTVSAKRRIQATVIGDAVNLASRLQNATKEVQRQILMDHTTFEIVKESIAVEPLVPITVKGKQEPVSIYSPTEEK